jgi:hypothetical protein
MLPQNMTYPVGWPVLYKKDLCAVVLVVHNKGTTDDIYYTIDIMDDDRHDREIQTVPKYLSSSIDSEPPELIHKNFQDFTNTRNTQINAFKGSF